MTDFPSIEELMAPHLAKLRAHAEAARNDRICRASIWFYDGDDPRVTTHVHVSERPYQTEVGFGKTVDEAIAGVCSKIKREPDDADLYAVLGLTADGKFA